VGKTTILTKIANNAFNMGFNVLQIFFEDNQKIIQRKHFTLWTGLANSELPAHKDDVMEKVREIRESQPNKLMLRKLPSDTLTMSHIKNYIRKIKAEGVTIDLLVVDYIDCILPDKSMAGADDWKSEGSVMRKFEAMCTELDIAGWTATQGNRSSISSDVVTTDQMGGSIKKAQVGHVIISIAKSLQQKEMNLATIAITKSRIGRDGIVFENCKFNNELLDIDTEQSVTFLGLEEKKEESAKQRQKELMDRRRQREQTL
jgi:replicative DNA helicase